MVLVLGLGQCTYKPFPVVTAPSLISLSRLLQYFLPVGEKVLVFQDRVLQRSVEGELRAASRDYQVL